MSAAPRTLVLNVAYPSRASYYDDWRDALLAAPELEARCVNVFRRAGRRAVARTITAHDAIVLLHSCTADSLFYVEPLREVLSARRGPLVAFIGNELNLPGSPLGAKIAFLKAVGADVIATQLPLEAGRYLYGATGARVIALPHALNPEAFRAEVPWEKRPIEIGGRGFRYLPLLGDDDRNRIVAFFRAIDVTPPLVIDFDENQRYDRAGWAAFLNRCRATASTEAGSFWVEPDDATMGAILALLDRRRGGLRISGASPLRRLGHGLPYPVKAALKRILARGPIRIEGLAEAGAEVAEIAERFFAHRPRPPAYTKCISSRHFDAIGTKTVQVMFPGRFNDILEADRHYIALAPDFANAEEVVRRLRDRDHVRAITEAAFEHVVAAHTYAHRTAALAQALSELV